MHSCVHRLFNQASISKEKEQYKEEIDRLKIKVRDLTTTNQLLLADAREARRKIEEGTRDKEIVEAKLDQEMSHKEDLMKLVEASLTHAGVSNAPPPDLASKVDEGGEGESRVHIKSKGESLVNKRRERRGKKDLKPLKPQEGVEETGRRVDDSHVPTILTDSKLRPDDMAAVVALLVRNLFRISLYIFKLWCTDTTNQW